MTTKCQKVLVVDDEELIRSLIAELLREKGYEVMTATNGSECLREIQEFRPNLIILDLDMPHVRGETAINMIRNHEGMREIPIIVVSGKGTTETLEALRFFDYGTFIPKPFDIDFLLESVGTHLTHVDHDIINDLLLCLGRKDSGLSQLATTAAGKRCDVYVTTHRGVELRLLIPEELTRLEMALLAQQRISERITVLANLGTHWKPIWPKPQFKDSKRQLVSLTR